MPATSCGRRRLGAAACSSDCAEHRRAVCRAGAVVVHRRALGAQHRGGLATVVARSTAGPRAPPRWRSARIGVAATPPSPIRARTTLAVDHVEREADGHAGDVVEPALGDLVERGDPASGSGIRTARISSPGRRTVCAVAGEVVGQRHLAVAVGEASTTVASSASSAGGRSPIGEPVPRLPPMVAPLRISREANCGNISSSSGTAPAEPALDLGQGQRGADLDARRRRPSSSRSSGSRSIATAYAARAPRMLTSTPQSVRAGDQVGVGVLGQQRQRLGQVARAGERPVGPVDPGRGRRRRRGGQPRGERVVGGGCAERVGGVADRAVAGAAAQVAAQRVQVEAVGAVLVVARCTVVPAATGARSAR